MEDFPGRDAGPAPTPARLFISYAREDEPFRKKLENHLAPLRHEGLVASWHDRLLAPGDDRQAGIDGQIEAADIILLLVSDDFLASDYCYGVEAKRALERHAAGDAVVVPVPVRPVDWQGSPFGKLQPLPAECPVSRPDNDAAWVDVAAGIRRLAGQVRARPAVGPRAGYPEVARTTLEQKAARILSQQRRLMLLAPRRGGAHTVARRLARAAGYGEGVTWLRPFAVAECSAGHYFGMLTGDPKVSGLFEYLEWQLARVGDAPHLIVLTHYGGPLEHLRGLGEVLRNLLEREGQRFAVLTAGGAQAAALRFQNLPTSVFSGMYVVHVPDMSEAEVAEVLQGQGQSPDLAPGLWRATGGHPGWLHDLLVGEGALDEAGVTDRLCHGAVRGALLSRLSEDDQATGLRTQARDVLRALLGGKPVEPLKKREDDLRWAEVRLYYDGLLRAGADGRTEFRCAAVRMAVEAELE